ncbi:MAG: hypothetical protein LWY06_06355 [Firmicutes bacterium]|nr:hypothetical protein [Bacillota bacterium]
MTDNPGTGQTGLIGKTEHTPEKMENLLLIMKKPGFLLFLFYAAFLILFCCKSASGSTSIMYFDPKSEVRISTSIKRARLSVPIYRIGVAKISGKRIGVIQFGIKDYQSVSEIARNAIELIFSSFGAGIDLDRVDIYGTDKPDMKGRKGVVLFSVSAKKEDIHKVDFSLPSTDALKVFGLVYYSETIPDKPKSWIKSIKKQYYLFRLEKIFKKLQNLKIQREKQKQKMLQKQKQQQKKKQEKGK